MTKITVVNFCNILMFVFLVLASGVVTLSNINSHKTIQMYIFSEQ